MNSLRVAMDTGGPAVSVTNKTDYYPFGMAMPGRHVDGGYRYAYQGQEKDGETGMEAFQLRLWDARIGRWLTVDPYGEFASPYLGMGNNPISIIDPTGGCTDCPNPSTVNSGELTPVVITVDVPNQITIFDVNQFMNGIESNFNQGLNDRIMNTVDFMKNDMLNSEYYAEQVYVGWNNIRDGRSIFNLSDQYKMEIWQGVSSMSLNDWAYTAGYSAPDIALGFAGGYTLTTIRVANGIKIGNVRLLTNFNNRLEGTLFQINRGKNFRIDFDWNYGPHYHRRGIAPGQGIGRHRPWQTKSTDTRFWDRF